MGQASAKALTVDAVISTRESEVKSEKNLESKNADFSESKTENLEFIFKTERFARMKKCLRKRSNSIL